MKDLRDLKEPLQHHVTHSLCPAPHRAHHQPYELKCFGRSGLSEVYRNGVSTERQKSTPVWYKTGCGHETNPIHSGELVPGTNQALFLTSKDSTTKFGDAK